MAIVLGSVNLSDHMIWEDEFTYDQVAQTAKRTLGGAQIVVSQQLFEGRPITLVASEQQGWLTKQQVQDVKALADSAGAVLSLTIGPQSFQVMFRHQDAPSFLADPLDQIGAQAPAGYYTAVIKLMTI